MIISRHTLGMVGRYVHKSFHVLMGYATLVSSGCTLLAPLSVVSVFDIHEAF